MAFKYKVIGPKIDEEGAYSQYFNKKVREKNTSKIAREMLHRKKVKLANIYGEVN